MKKLEKMLIKKAFYNYSQNIKSAVISTVEWAESNMAIDYGKVAVVTSPSNYKETQLCAILDESQKRLRWCYVVEKVLEHFKFDLDKIKFIRVHYFEKKGEVQTCLDVGICRATMFNWQNEVLDIGYKWARELRVLTDSSIKQPEFEV